MFKPHFWHFWPFHAFNNMFTQPLLFDDSLSLLQKIAMLWAKLKELIDDYNKFKEDFFAWKAEVEAALKELAEAVDELQAALSALDGRVDALEDWRSVIDEWKATVDSDLTNIKNQLSTIAGSISDLSDIRRTVNEHTTQISTLTTQTSQQGEQITTLSTNYTTLNTTVTNLGNTVTALGNDLTSLTARVSANETDISNIKDALSRLDVRLPTQLIDATNFDAVETAWFNWLADYCDSRTGNTAGTFAGIWSKTDDFHPGATGDHAKPRKLLTVGKVGQSFTQAVLPLMIKANLTTPTTPANETAVIAEVMNLITSSGLDKLYTVGLTSSTTSYFNFTMLEEYPYSNDNITFHTSYIMFNPSAWDTSVLSRMYKVSFDTSGGYTVDHANSINMDVRLNVYEDSDQGRLAVMSNDLYFIVYNGVVVVCFHAQNA